MQREKILQFFDYNCDRFLHFIFYCDTWGADAKLCGSKLQMGDGDIRDIGVVGRVLLF